MVGESDQLVFLIKIDASSLAEFEISEFEISRVDCTILSHTGKQSEYMVAITITIAAPQGVEQKIPEYVVAIHV